MQNEFDNMTLKDFENRGQDLLTRAKQVDDYMVSSINSIYPLVSDSRTL